jgi:hypothetical protein
MQMHLPQTARFTNRVVHINKCVAQRDSRIIKNNFVATAPYNNNKTRMNHLSFSVLTGTITEALAKA